MKTSSKIILTTVITLGITSGVFAFGAHKFSNMSMQDKVEMVNERVASKLDLDQAQQNNFNAMSSKMVTLMQQAKSQSGDHKAMIKGLISEQPLDQAALLERINTKTSLVNQHAPEMVALLATFVDSLKTEQKEELKEMIDHNMSRHSKGHEKGHGNKHNFN